MKQTMAAGLAVTAFIALSGAPAMARDLPSGGMTAQEVADWLKANNYPAQVKPDPSTPGDLIVSSSIDGVNFDIYFYVCKSGRCGSLQYAAGWWPSKTAPGTPEKFNSWDTEKRYLRAYTKKGQYWGEYDIDIDPGGTYESLNASLTRWRSIIGEFKTFLGY